MFQNRFTKFSTSFYHNNLSSEQPNKRSISFQEELHLLRHVYQKKDETCIYIQINQKTEHNKSIAVGNSQGEVKSLIC